MVNLLKVSHPLLWRELYQKSKIELSRLATFSNRLLSWQCTFCNGTFSQKVIDRVRSNAKPGCTNCRAALVDHTSRSLKNLEPNIALEYSAKNGILSTHLKVSSHYSALWNCGVCSASWKASVNSRTGPNRTRCPICAGRKLVKGVSDLATVFPEEALAWSTRNEFSASEVLPSSSVKAFWSCPTCGKEDYESPQRRTRREVACLACLRRGVKIGINDFQSLYPDLALEWDYDLNELSPAHWRATSQKAFWWRCKSDHSWEETLEARSRWRRPCPQCHIRHGSSALEANIAEALSSLGIVYSQNNRALIAPKELDFVVDKSKIAIEVNGTYWHSDAMRKIMGSDSAEAYHKHKASLTEAKGYHLLFIWEDDWGANPEEIMNALTNELEGDCSHLLHTLTKG